MQSFGGLIAVRLALGMVESGLFPGLAVYLTFFYTKKELALRIGYLFVSAALAGGTGGLLAYGIGHMNGLSGQSGWRWLDDTSHSDWQKGLTQCRIFIIEGLPTVVMGIAALWLLPNDPEHVSFPFFQKVTEANGIAGILPQRRR